MKSYHAVRRALDNRLVGSRRQLRPVIVDRAMLQHEARLLERCHVPFTDKHKQVRCMVVPAAMLAIFRSFDDRTYT